MVVAEIPLWVVHSNDASSTDTSRAQESLSLLETLGTGGKAPMYTVDCHGDVFATGGGDGKVRLWSTAALFAKHRGTFSASGDYASSGGSSGESGAEDDASSSSNNNSNSNDNIKNEARQEHDNDREEPTPAVHDLTNLVRRKKDTANSAAAAAATTTTATNTATNNKPPTATTTTNTTKTNTTNTHTTAATKPPNPLLCTLAAHTGSSVLCVRFSTTGNYLASAGDDAVVCIYKPDANNNATTHHHWSRIKLCRGHTLDVVDLAWAPDDSHLVSCSLDKDAPIIVWKLTDLTALHITPSNVLVHPYKILGVREHTSTVKGVTFDPAGTYVASSGDDPAVCIWRAHDDWGLEAKVEAEGSSDTTPQTLFRRLSWATDGTYICSTNGTMKKKHVASTIARDGWTSTGSASLVGHKQPVVVSRHLPRLLNAKPKDGKDDDDPDYATIVALGDKRGFVTVWSTRKSRPLFKLQCSESRCTVTDLAWGQIGNSVILLVTLLDGHAVALKFSQQELGPLLSNAEQKRVFSLRYGIDDDINGGGRRLFVGDNSGPKLIENALQFSLEEDEDDNDIAMSDQEEAPMPPGENLNTKQIETKKDGKKRIRPVLVTVNDDEVLKKLKLNGSDKKKQKKKMDTVRDALETAAKAASAAEGIQVIPHVAPTDTNGAAPSNHPPTTATPQNHRLPAPTSSLPVAQIPHSTNKVHTIDLPLLAATRTGTTVVNEPEKYTAECSNSTRIPKGSSGQPLLCTTLSVSRNGRATWKDDIVGTSCTAMAAGESILAVGTTDGTLYLYGNSPTLGWKGSTAFRSHPPLVFGQPIVALELYESDVHMRLAVVSADGSFGVYTMFPEMRVEFKGSILPPMTHMILSTNAPKSQSAPLPKLARVQITESGRLLLLLSLQGSATRDGDMGSKSPFRSATAAPSSGPGGSIQGFVYHNGSELWMRVADSRFVLSDFYTMLPSSKTTTDRVLAKLDDAVRSGVVSSSIKPSRRGGREEHVMYHANTNTDVSSVTRSHCEDRLACAMALVSAGEFEFWLTLYVRTLVQGGWEDHVRVLLDLLLGSSASSGNDESSCWWLSSAPTILGLDRQGLVKKIVIPEMSKNRAFQRLTNEISLEVAQR